MKSLDGVKLAPKLTHLKRRYKKLKQLKNFEIFNIINDFPINYTPKCLNCGNPVPFISLGKGYRKFCKKQCTTYYYRKIKGVDNISQLPEVKEKISKANSGPAHAEKIKKGFLKKYGVNNIFLTEEFKEKTKKTHLEKYGVDHLMKNKLEVEKRMRKREENCNNFFHYTQQNYRNFKDFNKVFIDEHFLKNGNYDIRKIQEYYNITENFFKLLSKIGIKIDHKKLRSSIEVIVENILKELGVSFIANDRRTIFPKEIDFLVEGRLAIEIQGDYWHANPQFFNEDDYVRNIPVKEIWKRDKLKKDLIIKKNLIYLEIWENEILFSTENVKDLIINTLKEK